MDFNSKRQCIWCRATDEQVEFNKVAHTIPQALGGKHICRNVCDDCNAFFGSHHQGDPSVETIIKETFNISRARFLATQNGIGKNKAMSKFSSVYFKVDMNKGKIALKMSYRLQKGFQEKIGRQIKRGLYKIYLEEVERQKGDGLNPKYDFIREFARYDVGDFPVFYFDRLYGMILMAQDWIVNPIFFLEEDRQMQYLVYEPSFFEFEFLGHVFGIVTSRDWSLEFDSYIEKSVEAKKRFFKSWKVINNFNDIDLILSVLND